MSDSGASGVAVVERVRVGELQSSCVPGSSLVVVMAATRDAATISSSVQRGYLGAWWWVLSSGWPATVTDRADPQICALSHEGASLPHPSSSSLGPSMSLVSHGELIPTHIRSRPVMASRSLEHRAQTV